MFAFFAGLAAGLLHVFSGPDHLAAVAPLAADRRSPVSGEARPAVGHRPHRRRAADRDAAVVRCTSSCRSTPISAYSERIVGLSLIASVAGASGARGAQVRGSVPHGHSHAGASFAMGTIHGLAGSSHLFGVLPALALRRARGFDPLPRRLRRRRDRRHDGVRGRHGPALDALGSNHHRRYSGLLYASSAAALVIGGFWLVGR